MFGAAGAPVTALGDFRPDPMSTASALLSTIAPAAPATSQGSATVDASAFEGLLASMMDGDMTGGGGDQATLSTEKTDDTVEGLAGAAVPAQTLPPAPQPILLIPEAEVAVEAPVDDAVGAAVGAAPTVAAPVPAPAPAPVIAAPVAAAPMESTKGSATVAPQPTGDAQGGKPADTDPQVRPAVKADGADDAQVQPLAPTDAKAAPVAPLTQPPAPTGTSAKADTAAPQTQPPVSPALPTRVRGTMRNPGEITDISTTAPVDTGAETAPTTTGQTPAPTVGKDAAPTPQVQPMAQPATAPKREEAAPVVPADALDALETADLTKAVAAPVQNAERTVVEESRPIDGPTLRALAERASRPVATNAAVDTAAPSSPTPTTTASATPAAAAPAMADAQAARPDIAAPVETVAEATDPTGDAPVEATAPDAAPSAQTAHAAREAAAPAMSRVAVEATAQIAAQILRRLEGRSTRFEMSLTPDELGRVDVKLDIDSEGRLAARLAFDNPAAAADLKGRADELRRQLEQQGFQVADDAFEFSQRDSGSSAFDRGQDARQGQSRAFAAASRLNADADVVAQPPRWTALSLTPAGVDMKV